MLGMEPSRDVSETEAGRDSSLAMDETPPIFALPTRLEETPNNVEFMIRMRFDPEESFALMRFERVSRSAYSKN